MSADKKPNPTARLKTLPEERQAQVIELMRNRSLEEAAGELAKDGLKTSRTALGEFWHWWHLRERFNQVSRFSEHMVDLLKEEEPGLIERSVGSNTGSGFSKRAIEMEQDDPEAASMIWYRMMRLNLKKSDQALLERRIKLLEAQAAKAEKAEAVLKEGALTPEQISEKLKDIFGISKFGISKNNGARRKISFG
jgi:hypothetical protein